MTLAQSLEAIATVVLSSFFIIITFAFFRYRLVRKQEELNSLIDGMNLGEKIGNFKDQMRKEFSPRDYALPLIFVTVVSFIGLFLLLLGWMLYDIPEDTPLIKSMLWSGAEFWNDDVYGREKKSLAIVAWSILGGYMGGAQYIYRRFATIDLTPGNFFSLGIRMIIAPVIALLIAFATGWDSPEVSNEGVLVIAFLTGLFPERGMKVLMDRASGIFPTKNDNEVENFPLEAIQGVSYFHRVRLNEVGIDNVQNLAQFNFLLLVIKTPFPVRVLLDWVSQAKLLMEFHEDTPALTKVGIRSALDYVEATDQHPERLPEIARITGLEQILLEVNLKNLSTDKSLWLLREFKSHLEKVRLD